RSSVTTIFANFVVRSLVSAITQTPASGPLAPVTTPPISSASIRTASAVCWPAVITGAAIQMRAAPTATTLEYSHRVILMARLLYLRRFCHAAGLGTWRFFRTIARGFWPFPRKLPGADLGTYFASTCTMRSMTATDQRVTYAEMLEWPDDGRRYELYDGEVVVVPSPVLRHQRVAFHVMDVLREYEESVGGLVVPAPFDIVFSQHNVV